MKRTALSLLLIAALALPAHSTDWVWRNHVIVPVEDAERIREISASIDPDPASTGGFTVRLSAAGEEPATHVAANSVITQEMLEKMQVVLSDWKAQGLSAAPQFWRMDARTEELVVSNVSSPAKEWSFEQSLKAAGLQVIRTEAAE